MPKVVITRPHAQAIDLARRAAALGHDAVVFPLLEIHPLQDPAPLRRALQQLESYALVAFVSPNAIDAVFNTLGGWPAAVPIAVMGEGSRAALAHHGVGSDNAIIFSPRDPRRTDSETLLQVLDLETLRGRRTLILRGESGRELLADALRAAGVEVDQVAAYRRRAPVLDDELRERLLGLLADRNDWIVTSSEGMRNLLHLADELQGDAVAKLQQQNIIVPHARIAETARELGFAHVVLSASGDEHLLAALQSGA